MANATKTCPQCGDQFTLNTSPVNIARQKFCSRKCAAVSYTTIPPLIESLKHKLESRVQRLPTGCWLYTGQTNGHYGQLEYRRKTYLAHRASYMVYKGVIPKGMRVCHSCDAGHCINPEHLWLGSAKQNTQDMMKKNRHWSIPHRKLNDINVAAIKRMLIDGVQNKKIAEQFSVSPSLISAIKHGRRNAHIAPSTSASQFSLSS